MSLPEHPDNLAALIGKVTPDAREALAQVFLDANTDPEVDKTSFDEDVQRIIKWIAMSVVRFHERAEDAPLYTQIAKAAASTRAQVRTLVQQLAALIALDPELVDEAPFASEEIGRIGRYMRTLRRLDGDLGDVAAEFRRPEGRPRSPMAVFLVACKIWKSRFNCAPPFNSETKSPLFNAIDRIAREMDSKAISAFSFAAFKNACRRCR